MTYVTSLQRPLLGDQLLWRDIWCLFLIAWALLYIIFDWEPWIWQTFAYSRWIISRSRGFQQPEVCDEVAQKSTTHVRIFIAFFGAFGIISRQACKMENIYHALYIKQSFFFLLKCILSNQVLDLLHIWQTNQSKLGKKSTLISRVKMVDILVVENLDKCTVQHYWETFLTLTYSREPKMCLCLFIPELIL